MGVLADAELLLQAKNYSGTGDWLDESGNGHNGQLGSTSGADTNDPLFLEPDGGVGGAQYLWSNGISGNYASSPHSAALATLTGDVVFEFDMALDDWTPPAVGYWVDKFGGVGSRAFRVSLSGGWPELRWSEDGTASLTISSPGATGFTDGTRHTIKLAFDADDGSGNRVLTSYRDGVLWGTTVVAGATSIFNASGRELGIFGRTEGSGQPLGKMYRMRIWSDLAETTLVFDADFTDRTRLKEPFATLTEKANDAVVTINRAATDKPATVVDRPMLLFDGVDDYIEVADHADLDFALTDSFTVMVTGRTPDITPAADDVLYSKQTNLTTGAGYSLYLDTGGTFNGVVADGTNSTEDVSAAGTNNVAWVAAMVRNVGDDDVEAFKDGTGSGTPTTDATTGTSANALPVRLGAVADTAANFYTGQIMAVVLWRRALTDTEIVTAGDELTLQTVPNVVGNRMGGTGAIRRRGGQPR